MAFPSNLILTVSFLLLAVYTLPSSKAGLVDDVCSQPNPDSQFCKSAFGSDSRSATADLATLGQIGIALAQSHTKSTVSLLKSILGGVSDPKLKEIYGACLELYNEASVSLDNASSALNGKDYKTMNVNVSAALDAPVTCGDNFSQSPEPANLKQAGVQVGTLSSALLYIANGLLQGH